jgi:hypothetical protein
MYLLAVYTLKFVYTLLRSHHFDMLAIPLMCTRIIYGFDAGVIIKYM